MKSLVTRLALCLTLAAVGCSNEARYAARVESDAAVYTESVPLARAAAPASAMEPSAPAMGMMMAMGGEAPPPAEAAAPGAKLQDAPPPGANLARKIIYDAQIDLFVTDIDPAAEKLLDLIQSSQGYLAEQNLSGSPGTERSGRWKVRVPVENFEEFVAGVLTLGELDRNYRTSQDVTEQFYDIEARIKNKKVEEETLLKILEERMGALEDVLKVEVELSRVRGEIEQLEGRLRVLANLSSLATVTINLKERVRYQPTEPVVASFGTRIQRAWESSIRNFVDGFQDLAEWAVASWIWVLAWLIGLFVLALIVRSLLRRLIRNAPRLWELARAPLTRPRTGADTSTNNPGT